MRIVADHLAGVELVERVERILDLAEDLGQLTVLLAQELRSGASPHASEPLIVPPLEHDRRRRRGQRLEPARSPGSERSRNGRKSQPTSPAQASSVQVSSAAGAGLKSLKTTASCSGGHRDIIDDRDRPGPTARSA